MKLKKAVLIIHGFAGGTYDQEKLAFQLELNAKFDVYNFTLPGHDKTIIKHVTMEDWVRASEEIVELLIRNGYSSIYLIGHSMGGVIACYLSTRYRQIKRLVLAAPAFEIIDDSNDSIFKKIKNKTLLLQSYNKSQIVHRIIKIPFRTSIELKRLVRKYSYFQNKVKVPVLIIHGTNDHLVPIKSSRKLLENIKSKRKKLIIVKDLNHYTYKDIKQDYIIKQTELFLKKIHLKSECKIIDS